MKYLLTSFSLLSILFIGQEHMQVLINYATALETTVGPTMEMTTSKTDEINTSNDFLSLYLKLKNISGFMACTVDASHYVSYTVRSAFQCAALCSRDGGRCWSLEISPVDGNPNSRLWLCKLFNKPDYDNYGPPGWYYYIDLAYCRRYETTLPDKYKELYLSVYHTTQSVYIDGIQYRDMPSVWVTMDIYLIPREAQVVAVAAKFCPNQSYVGVLANSNDNSAISQQKSWRCITVTDESNNSSYNAITSETTNWTSTTATYKYDNTTPKRKGSLLNWTDIGYDDSWWDVPNTCKCLRAVPGFNLNEIEWLRYEVGNSVSYCRGRF